MSRYAVFIDGGYAKKVLNQFGHPKVSYLKFSELVGHHEERLRTYYYDCPPYVSPCPTPEERAKKSAFDRFTFALEREPRFQVRLGRLAKRRLSDHTIIYEQKMVDILLAVDLVQLSVQHQIQRAVLLANDSDFVPALRIAKDAGTVIALYYGVPPRPHDELMSACDECFLIDESLVEKIKV